MRFEIDKKLDKEFRKIYKTDKNLFKKIEKQLDLFGQNHLHPSLRLHKLAGKQAGVWSVSVDGGIRMLLTMDENGAYFFDIGTHNQVYRVN